MPPPQKNVAYTFNVALYDMTASGVLKANPTLASGDFKISKDNGSLTNITTPTVTPTGGVLVEIALTADEMNCDRVSIVGIDQTTPKEWADLHVSFDTDLPVTCADALLKRDWTAVTGSPPAYSVWNALRLLRNAWSLVAGTPPVLHVKDEAGSDAWTRNVTTDDTAEPVTGVS